MDETECQKDLTASLPKGLVPTKALVAVVALETIESPTQTASNSIDSSATSGFVGVKPKSCFKCTPNFVSIEVFVSQLYTIIF